MSHPTRILFGSFLLALTAGCSGSGPCREAVPFSADNDLSQADADRIATELGVSSIDGRCDEVCTVLSDETTSPDGSTYTITSIETCDLLLPTMDAMGDPVAGFVRCMGVGTRCD